MRSQREEGDAGRDGDVERLDTRRHGEGDQHCTGVTEPRLEPCTLIPDSKREPRQSRQSVDRSSTRIGPKKGNALRAEEREQIGRASCRERV